MTKLHLVSALCLFPVLQSLSIAQESDSQHRPPSARYQSSNSCKGCHPGIYKYWTNSMHSHSISDPVFQMAYARAIVNYGVKVREFCLSCHSPTTNITKDYDLKDPISQEGITCDFCHTVTNVIEGKPKNSFEVQLGDTKFGPKPGIEPIGGMEFRYSALHKSAKLCAGCHELESDNGVKVLGTYTEWGSSIYAQRGIQCQNCHMPELFDVPAVAPNIRETSNMAHAHEFLGGHSQIRLEKAATLVTSAKRERDSILVDVYITNEEAGHCIPTGMPTRKVVLTVLIKDGQGQVISRQERIYEKVLLDKDGNEIKSAECVMKEATAVKSDNRIKPKETRLEQFTFANIKDGTSYIVEANLKYNFEVATLERNVMSVNMAGATKIINLEGNGLNYELVIIIVITVLLVFAIFVVLLRSKNVSKRSQ